MGEIPAGQICSWCYERPHQATCPVLRAETAGSALVKALAENEQLQLDVSRTREQRDNLLSEVAHLKTSLAEHMSLTAQALKELKSALAPTQRPRRT